VASAKPIFSSPIRALKLRRMRKFNMADPGLQAALKKALERVSALEKKMVALEKRVKALGG
jgi:hypothetical protein